MTKVNVKRIREKATMMNAAWIQLASGKTFNGVTDTAFQAKLAAAAAKDEEIAKAEAALKTLKDDRDNLYSEIDADRVKVRAGVEGDSAYGNDSGLYEAMGFIRKSERASGLTRKKNGTSG